MRQRSYVAMCVSVVVLFFATGSSRAASIKYQLKDNPDGALTSPTVSYGLRMDELGKTFSTSPGVFLYYDANNLTASIEGTLLENGTSNLWDVEYVMTGVTSSGAFGFTSTGGEMTLSDGSTSYTYDAKQDHTGLAFILANDGHRHPDPNGWSARGWIMATGTNDWLVHVCPAVPVPSSAAMLFATLGLVGGGASLRRYLGRDSRGNRQSG